MTLSANAGRLSRTTRVRSFSYRAVRALGARTVPSISALDGGRFHIKSALREGGPAIARRDEAENGGLGPPAWGLAVLFLAGLALVLAIVWMVNYQQAFGS